MDIITYQMKYWGECLAGLWDLRTREVTRWVNVAKTVSLCSGVYLLYVLNLFARTCVVSGVILILCQLFCGLDYTP